jgi:outer membrane protein assembly factor BamB
MPALDAVCLMSRERRRSTILLLGLAITLLLAACGQTVGGAVPPPVVGDRAGGQYESVLASGGTTYLGAANGIVSAFQSSSGKLLWQRNLGGSAGLSTLTSQVVYAEASGESRDTAYALDADTGAVLWRFTFPTPIADLAVASGAVFANDDDPSGAGSTIYALRASDGALLWRYRAPIAIPQSVEAAGGIVYAEGVAPSGGVPPSLYAVRASDGQLLWTYQTGGEFALPPVANGVAYVAVGDGPMNTVDAVDSLTGTCLWRFTADADQSFIGRGTVPTVADGVVYVAASSRVYALRASDGQVLWRASRANTGVPIPEQPVVGDGALYVKEGDSGLAAVRARDGTLLWHQHVGNIFGMSEDQGLMLAITQSNVADGLRASNGSVLWTQPIDSFATWDPASLPYAVAGGRLFVATEKGTLQAIRAADGTRLWHYTAPPPEG